VTAYRELDKVEASSKAYMNNTTELLTRSF